MRAPADDTPAAAGESAPAPLRGAWRAAALVWVTGVVVLYLAVRELGLAVLP